MNIDNNNNRQAEQESTGRTHNSGTTTQPVSGQEGDISAIDQQEGAMHNGEVGDAATQPVPKGDA